jgi:hypothetical protein
VSICWQLVKYRCTRNGLSRPGGAESRLNDQSLVEKWRLADQKWFLQKNRELVLLPLKCKLTPVTAKSVGACAKSKIYLWRFPQWNESWYAYPRWSIIYVGCCAQLLISHFGRRFTHKKPDFGTPKMEKTIFMGRNENQPPWHSSRVNLDLHPKGHARVRYSLVPTNYAMIRAEPSPFDLKVV